MLNPLERVKHLRLCAWYAGPLLLGLAPEPIRSGLFEAIIE